MEVKALASFVDPLGLFAQVLILMAVSLVTFCFYSNLLITITFSSISFISLVWSSCPVLE